MAECDYPRPGETYQWYKYGRIDSGMATWGKSYNDGPIANIEFFINKGQKPGEPLMICAWEEMQGNITALHDCPDYFGTYYAYMKDIKISLSYDGIVWSAPYNITDTPDRDEGELSVYRDVIDNKIHLVYSEDGLAGSDVNLEGCDGFKNKYLQDWYPISSEYPTEIRKSSTEQVKIIYREFDLSEIPATMLNEDNSPGEFKISQSYPNPFNPTTTIVFSVSRSVKVNISVYDIQGKLIEILMDNTVTAGQHQVTWDAGSFSSGMYFYRIETDGFTQTKKCLLLK
jgi:hypothetical protein